jgi:His-Xaa-Ser system protein HxsD
VAESIETSGLEWVEHHADRLVLQADSSLYPDEAVFRACYTFTDRCYLFLEREGDALRVSFRKRRQSADLNGIVGEFSNELINQRIRHSLARETRAIREMIVSQAFAEAKFDGT